MNLLRVIASENGFTLQLNDKVCHSPGVNKEYKTLLIYKFKLIIFKAHQSYMIFIFIIFKYNLISHLYINFFLILLEKFQIYSYNKI